MSKFLGHGLLLLLSVLPATAIAQVQMGLPGMLYGGNVNPAGVETNVNLYNAVNFGGQVTSATFGWSAGPCPAAVKIKFFRPIPLGNPLLYFSFIAERGPFDVTQPVQTSHAAFPPVTQTVALEPAVSVAPGDVIAITNLTQCGGPTFAAQLPLPLPPFPSASFPVPGDATSTVGGSGNRRPGIFVTAAGPVSGLLLLDRFQVTVEATDPRTGRTTTGSANRISGAAGYFSLPDFTGDPSFPEITVKMVDATASPGFGGSFWFFHSPLTDVSYTLRVADLLNGRVRSYSSALPSAPGQLCGGVDTGAFIP